MAVGAKYEEPECRGRRNWKTQYSSREFAHRDLGGRKTGYFQSTLKSWIPR